MAEDHTVPTLLLGVAVEDFKSEPVAVEVDGTFEIVRRVRKAQFGRVFHSEPHKENRKTQNAVRVGVPKQNA